MSKTLQPVAVSPADKDLQSLMAAMGRGDFAASAITKPKLFELLRYARTVERKMLGRIRDTATRRGVRASRRAVTNYHQKLAVRFVHLWDSAPPEYRSTASTSASVDKSHLTLRLQGVIDRLDAVSSWSPSTARLTTRSKRDGQHRPIYRFGWTEQARFRLFKSALEPFAGFHASQFQFAVNPRDRGSQAACKALLNALIGIQSKAALNASPFRLEEYAFLELDVEDFFGSLKEEWWGTKPVLDDRLKKVLYADYLQVKVSKRVRDRLPGAFLTSSRGGGLPQGSALSALISEWVMGDILKEVPDLPLGVFLFTYCDNIGVLAPRTWMGAIEELISETFLKSPAGTFNLRDKGGRGAVSVSQPFHFLGMEYFMTTDGHSLKPPGDVAELTTIMKRNDISLATDEGALAKVERSVLGMASAWKLWPGMETWRDTLLASVHDQRRLIGSFSAD